MISIRKLRLSCHQNAKKGARGHWAPLENSPAYSNPHEYMSVLAFIGYTQLIELYTTSYDHHDRRDGNFIQCMYMFKHTDVKM